MRAASSMKAFGICEGTHVTTRITDARLNDGGRARVGSASGIGRSLLLNVQRQVIARLEHGPHQQRLSVRRDACDRGASRLRRMLSHGLNIEHRNTRLNDTIHQNT